jgi:hypothetical protein
MTAAMRTQGRHRLELRTRLPPMAARGIVRLADARSAVSRPELPPPPRQLIAQALITIKSRNFVECNINWFATTLFASGQSQCANNGATPTR